MLYAFENGNMVIVGAADDMVDFEKFIAATNSVIVSGESLGVKSAELCTLVDVLTEDYLQGFKRCPVVVEHLSAETRHIFEQKFNIAIVKRNACLSKHEAMINALVADPYSASEATDQRSIEEIYGLDEKDEWDERSEEEKEQDAAYKKAYEDAAKKGEISGDSFGPNPNRKKKGKKAEGEDKAPELHVTDVRAHETNDGEIKIDNILAVKGLHDTREGEPDTYEGRIRAPLETNGSTTMADALARRRRGEPVIPVEKRDAPDESVLVAVIEDDTTDLEINTKGAVAIYHKVEVTGSKLADIWPVLEAADIYLKHEVEGAVVQRNSPDGCWFAYYRQLQAEGAAKALTVAGFNVETYAVNDAGERLVPKGSKVSVVDTLRPDEIEPRPWNFRGPEIRKMNAEAKRLNVKSMSPKEFIFVGSYHDAQHGTVIYITPASYFRDKGKMWEKPLDIAHILPRDIEELNPGVYRTRSRDWNNVSFDLHSRGFKENLMLQLYLNQL
jgi:hypothetical protein